MQYTYTQPHTHTHAPRQVPTISMSISRISDSFSFGFPFRFATLVRSNLLLQFLLFFLFRRRAFIPTARSLDKFNHPFHLPWTWIKLNRYKYYFFFSFPPFHTNDAISVRPRHERERGEGKVDNVESTRNPTIASKISLTRSVGRSLQRRPLSFTLDNFHVITNYNDLDYCYPFCHWSLKVLKRNELHLIVRTAEAKWCQWLGLGNNCVCRQPRINRIRARAWCRHRAGLQSVKNILNIVDRLNYWWHDNFSCRTRAPASSIISYWHQPPTPTSHEPPSTAMTVLAARQRGSVAADIDECATAAIYFPVICRFGLLCDMMGDAMPFTARNSAPWSMSIFLYIFFSSLLLSVVGARLLHIARRHVLGMNAKAICTRCAYTFGWSERVYEREESISILYL